ncbi:MAG: methylated-DNA--[protein]-cysteine S-methyltransferase [Thermomicrobiales bacterium]|nr:methylated-DNA--[protein]-cysteine S-methyltransferase [Thermomicrobiales bacterium]
MFPRSCSSGGYLSAATRRDVDAQPGEPAAGQCVCSIFARLGPQVGGERKERHVTRGAAKVAYVDQVLEHPGPFTFAVDEAGALLWVQFLDGDYAETAAELLARRGFHLEADAARTAAARRQLEGYCRGERRVFTLPLALRGTPWQQAVWQAVAEIPFGETRTYGEVATGLGRPRAARAMGRANATNPLPIVVPCHRVVGTSGALTGYAGGLHIKQRLLKHEARVLAGG